MKILGYKNDRIKFENVGGKDIFTLNVGYRVKYNNGVSRYLEINRGKHIISWSLEKNEGQLHIPNGVLTTVTGFIREYFSPYSWKSIFIEKDGKTKKALIHYPDAEDKKLIELFGESPYWTKVIGNDCLLQVNGHEFLISKNQYWTARPVGFRADSFQYIQRSKEGYVPIYRANTLYQKIKLIFWKIFGFNPRFWLEVKSPSSGEKFWLRPIDYKVACKILEEDLIYDKSHQECVNAEWVASDSTQVNWVVSS